MNLQQLKEIKENFVRELKVAHNGKKNSLAFIVHELPSKPIVKNGETFQTLVIGGSMSAKGLLKKNGKNVELLNSNNKPQPVFLTKDDLFHFIEQELDPKTRVLALNFAYPLKPVYEKGKLDGILMHGTKENVFAGLVGEKIGAELEQYFQKKLNRKVVISDANDTICLLLSGASTFKRQSLGAGIVGTGYNVAFFLDDTHTVSLESGNFDKFPLSEEVQELDKNSAAPSKQLFEKTVAGAYVFQQFNLLLKKRGIDFPPVATTKEVSDLAAQAIQTISPLANELFEYSAAHVACQLAAITQFKNHDMTFVMEGSFFWKGHNYKETVAQYLTELVPEYKISFKHIEHSPLLGAAKLVA